jgi:hypothetical protein
MRCVEEKGKLTRMRGLSLRRASGSRYLGTAEASIKVRRDFVDRADVNT